MDVPAVLRRDELVGGAGDRAEGTAARPSGERSAVHRVPGGFLRERHHHRFLQCRLGVLRPRLGPGRAGILEPDHGVGDRRSRRERRHVRWPDSDGPRPGDGGGVERLESRHGDESGRAERDGDGDPHGRRHATRPRAFEQRPGVRGDGASTLCVHSRRGQLLMDRSRRLRVHRAESGDCRRDLRERRGLPRHRRGGGLSVLARRHGGGRRRGRRFL